MKTTRRSQSGFTLIELMIVVAIIGILAAVAIPAFMDYMRKGKRSEADIALNQLSKNAITYFSEHGGYPTEATTAQPDANSCDNDRRLFTKGFAFTGGLGALGFNMSEDFRFDYSYTPGDTPTKFVAIAHADVDCDGTGAGTTVTLTANTDAAGNPIFDRNKVVDE